MEQFSADTMVLALVWYAAFLFSITVHEAAHAWAALKLGDETAYLGGQVTLNPLPHMQREPFGTILVPLISYLMAGWMMGWASAPYDPHWSARHPRRAAWMALAGPASNLLVVILVGVTIRVGMIAGIFGAPNEAHFSQITIGPPGLLASLATLLSILFSLNLLLFAFNLLPLPPLDGSGALPLVLPTATAQRYQEIMREPMWSLLGLIIAWNVFGQIFRPIHTLALNLLYPGMGYH